MKPNRAIYKTDKMFMPVITPDTISGFEFPKNIFMLKAANSDDALIPPFILSSASYSQSNLNNQSAARRILSEGLEEVSLYTEETRSRKETFRILQATSSDSRTVPNASSMNSTLFSNDRTFLPIPYLPYFSNCTYYGSQLFLYPLIESHPSCKLIREENVQPISNMKFGMQPEADTCKNIALQCRYFSMNLVTRKTSLDLIPTLSTGLMPITLILCSRFSRTLSPKKNIFLLLMANLKYPWNL